VGAWQAELSLQLMGMGTGIVTGSHCPVATLHTRSGGQLPAVQDIGARGTQLPLVTSQRSAGAQPVSSLQPPPGSSRALQLLSATSQYWRARQSVSALQPCSATDVQTPLMHRCSGTHCWLVVQGPSTTGALLQAKLLRRKRPSPRADRAGRIRRSCLACRCAASSRLRAKDWA
jgi:hypothetical protein